MILFSSFNDNNLSNSMSSEEWGLVVASGGLMTTAAAMVGGCMV